jgi:hypothetical protein
MYTGLHVKHALFLSDFDKLEFSRKDFRGRGGGGKLKYQVSLKIRLVGAELFHADGQTWKQSRFAQFCERA